MKNVSSFIAMLAMLGTAANAVAAAPVATRRSLTLDGARQVIAAVRTEAERLKAPGGAIAVVDDGGSLVAVERLDGTFAAGAAISIGKARTAAIFKRPTSAFEDIIKGGRTPMIALDDFTPLQGGVPIIVDGEVVGAVGVSGAASAQQDDELAQAGARALAGMTTARVDHFPGRDVKAAFEKGRPLIEVDGYKVHASRRDAAGEAEVHLRDTDIMYVLDGEATLVTGGSVVDGKTTAPEEVRGRRIEGGETLKLAQGDVVVIPNGVPHWFQAVEPPFTYYVVKAR